MRRRTATQPISRKAKVHCFYCGSPATTQDHVPPKQFLLRPYPDNLTTVRCCVKCNTGLGRDEEYVLAVLGHLAEDGPLARRMEDGGDLDQLLTYRATGLADRITDALVVESDGRISLRVEWPRCEAVFRKLAIGLYYRRYGLRPPWSGIIRVDAFASARWPGRSHAQALTERFTPKRWEVIQPGVFAYIFVASLRYPGTLLCLIDLYGTLCVEVTCPRPRGKRVSLGSRKDFGLQGRLF